MKFNEFLYPKKLLDHTKSVLRKQKSRTNNEIPKFIFLCGKKSNNSEQDNRNQIKKFYESSNNVFVLFAEELWKNLDIDLLSFEQIISHTSDCTLLFLESFGTATELGAFTSEELLLDKLFVYADKNFSKDDSFINNGPLKKLKSKTKNISVVYDNINSIFGNYILLDKLNSLINMNKTCIINQNSKSVDFGSYCIEILDIISMFGPIHRSDIIELYKYIKGFGSFSFSFRKGIKIPANYALDLLMHCNLIIQNKYDYIFTNTSLIKKNLLLFDLTDIKFDKLHLKYLSRKFKYLDFKFGDDLAC